MNESWVTTEKQKQNLQTAEMKHLRRVIGKTIRGKIRNQTIRMTLGTKPSQNKIEQAQLRWFGHLKRMDEERLTNQVWEARTEGLGNKRPRGRPCRTWNDNIQELLTKKNITWTEAKKLSEDRTAWRALCKTSTLHGTRGTD
jgi:hypothetical protein